jgi:hypothetical protein
MQESMDSLSESMERMREGQDGEVQNKAPQLEKMMLFPSGPELHQRRSAYRFTVKLLPWS